MEAGEGGNKTMGVNPFVRLCDGYLVWGFGIGK